MSLLPVLIACLSAADLPTPEAVAEIVRPAVEAERVVGVSLAVVRRDGSASYHFGRTALDGSLPDDGTVYEIGSVTKTFTGLWLAKEVAAGRLSPDTAVADFLPAGSLAPRENARAITLRDLVTHRSGLPRMPGNLEPSDSEDPYADYTDDRLLEFVHGSPSVRPAGAQAEYSNLGAGLLGYILAEHDGTTYAKGIEREIVRPVLDPSGAPETAVALSKGMRRKLAQGFTAGLTAAKPWELASLAGAGGIRSNTLDMTKYVRAYLVPDGHPLTAAVRLAGEPLEEYQDDQRIAYGWIVDADGVRWHNGQTGGYHSYVAFDTAAGVGVVVLANTATDVVDRIGSRLLALANGGEPEALKFRKPLAVPQETLGRYVGRYGRDESFVLRVFLENGRLVAQATAQPKFGLFATKTDRFVLREVEAAVEFAGAEGGPAETLVLFQNGLRQEFPRLPPE